MSLGLPEGRFHAAAHAVEQPDRRVAAPRWRPVVEAGRTDRRGMWGTTKQCLQCKSTEPVPHHTCEIRLISFDHVQHDLDALGSTRSAQDATAPRHFGRSFLARDRQWRGTLDPFLG